MADLGSLLGSAGIGGAIGKAIVSLELDTAKYQAELKGAQAETVASANSMNSGFAKFGGVASAAFAAAGVAAVAFGAFSVKAAVEANEAHLKLANTFKNNANLSDSSVAAFEKQAGALRDLTGVDDEAIISSQALLGAFDLTGKQVQELIPLIVDLSAKYGVDLDAAAKAVGKAVEGNTGSLARYGITLDKAAVASDGFSAVLEGLGKNAGFAASRAEAEPWRVLGAQFEEVAESVGQALLPVLQDLVKAADDLMPVLEFLARNLDLVLAGFLAFGAAKFLPGLIDAIAVASIRLAAAMGASLTTQGAMSAGLGTLSAIAGPIAVGIVGIGYAIKKMGDSAADTAKKVDDLTKSLIDGKISIDAAHDSIVRAEVGTGVFAGRLPKVTQEANKVADAAVGVAETMGRVAMASSEASARSEELVAHEDALAAASGRVTESLKKQLQATLDLFDPTLALIHAVQDNAAAEKDLAQAREHLNKLAREGKRDTDAYREAHQAYEDAVLGAAESQANLITSALALRKAVKDGKTDIDSAVQSIRDIGKAAGLSKAEIATLAGIVRKGLADAKSVAISLAPPIGKAITDGIAAGIHGGEQFVYTTIDQVVQNAITSARRTAGAHSPSTEMIKLGLDMMEGLYIGIDKGAQKVIDAAKKATQKLIDGFQSDLDKVKGLAKDFADTIKSGFSSFLDIGGAFGSAEEGTPLSAVIAQQLGGAQELADVLNALKRQGAGKALLSQVAQSGAAFGQTILQGGPEQVQEMNNALQEIADLAQQTGKGLSEAFFGDKIDKVSAKLDKQNEKMQELIDIEKLGHTHAIVLDGVKVTEAIRSELIKTGKRNDGTGIL